MNPFIQHIGLILLGGVFVWAGLEHFLRFRTITGQLGEQGFPAPVPLLAAGSLLEIAAGLCVVLGFHRPYAAAALVVFTIAASALALNFWRYSGPQRRGLRSAFIINIAVIGGLFLAMTI
nr:DoxX family protein [Mesorhizobium loti]